MTKKTIIKIIAYCTIFLVPFLISPVEIISQVQMISIIFVLAFIISLASIIKFVRQSYVKLTRIDILVVLFMLYQGYAIVRIPVATRDTINIYMYLATFIFYIHSRNILTVKSPIILFHTVIFAVLGQVLYSLFYQTNNFISIANIHGTFFNSGLLAGFISLATVSLVILIDINFRNNYHLWGKRVPQILLIITTILLIYIIFKLTSRAALIASSCGIIIILFPRMLATIKTLLSTTGKKVIISLFTILLLASVGYYLYQMKPRSAEGRILVWLSTAEMIKEKPVFGFGGGGFRQNYMNYQAEYLSTPKGKIFSDVASDTSLAFNEPLKIFAEQGVIGILLMLVLLLNIFKTKNEKFHRDLISLKALLCTIIVFGLFSYPSESITFQVTFYAIIAQISRLSGQRRILHVNKYTIVILSSFIIVIYSCIGGFLFSYLNSISRFNKIASQSIIDKQSVISLGELYPCLSSTVEYLSFYGQSLNRLKEYKMALFILQQQERCFPSSKQRIELGISLYGLRDFDEANEKWIEASRMVPALIRPHYLLTKSYFLQGKKELGFLQAEIVLTKKPKINTPEIYYMKQEIKKISARQEVEISNVKFNYNKNEKSKEKMVFLDSNVHDTCSTANVSRVSRHVGNR